MSNNSRRKKIDRQSLYVTVVVLLMMAAIIAAIGVSLAKSKSIIEETLESARANRKETSSPEIELEANFDLYDTEDVFRDDNDTNAPETEGDRETQSPDSSAGEPDTEDAEGASGEAPSLLPEFSAPVAGEVIKPCSLETPVFSQTMDDYRTHTGVDLYCPVGENVYCVADGTVLEVWDDPLMGMSVSVEHSGGAVSVYQGLSDTVAEGIVPTLPIERGQVIGTNGDTALIEIAEESHIHFELTVNGEKADPCDYIDFSSSPTYEG
ncbi:MAG: M23 family metallopeptidase [Clostridia bacterium]|nr:M23 family metallopeptidase [Clostridia bacterium]